MRKFSPIIVLAILASGVHAGELLDRIVVTVNGNALLQSDWDGELHYESLMAARPFDEVTPKDRDSALNRIIDQELLREQMRPADLKPVNAAEVEAQLDLLKAQYQREHEGQSWSASLDRHGISEAEIRAHVQVELNQLRAIDLRLRPSVEVDNSAVESYYKEKVVPQAAGKQPMTFAEAEPKIREILVQEQMNHLLDSWLESLRSQAKIQRFASDSSVPARQP
jgi:peptidyl-prolyl cis-trans isomerase SurA